MHLQSQKFLIYCQKKEPNLIRQPRVIGGSVQPSQLHHIGHSLAIRPRPAVYNRTPNGCPIRVCIWVRYLETALYEIHEVILKLVKV